MTPAFNGESNAERRHVTVLFCDLVGSTTLSEHLDPEDLRDVIRAYQSVAVEAVAAGEGHIAQYLGDGVLAYFGYPTAHEDDARRALRTALAIVAGVADLARRLANEGGPSVAVRIGIESGPVVVGEMGAGEQTERLAIGDIPNIAARLQAVAGPGQVVIGERTRRLVDGAFVLSEIGPQTIRGLSRTIDAYLVDAEALPSPMTRTTPLIGREREMAIIDDAFRRAAAGNGCAVEVIAEPGIGKSRLLLAAEERLAGEDHDTLVLRSSPYARNTELHPVIELLRRRFGLKRDEPADRSWERIREVVSRATPLSNDAAILFAALLSVPVPAGTTRVDRSAREERDATLESLIAWLLDAAQRRPQVVVAEDLQWSDPSTLELLARILDRIEGAAVLCLFAFRPGLEPPWLDHPRVTRIDLERLGEAQTARLAMATAGEGRLSQATLNEVVRRTDGVPLFVEELTKAVLEFEADGDVGDVAVPATLQSSLMARLDRLGADARAFAQLASVLGRDVPLELLEAVAGIGEYDVDRLLEVLAAADLMRPPTGDTPGAWSFKHALVQETAYGSMLKRERRRRHRLVAETLERQFSDLALARPELVALHWREGGLLDAALDWFGRAGSAALARSAAREAQAHFREALEILAATGSTGTPAEMGLQVGLGGACIVSDGYVTPEVERAFRRALEIGSQSGDGHELLPALHGLWLHALIAGRFTEAVDLSERIRALSGQLGNQNLMAEGEYARGLTALFMGDAAMARALLAAAVDLVDPDHPRSLVTEHRADASYRVFLAAATWATGSPDEAAAIGAQAVEIADRHGHPYTSATVFAWHGVLLQLLGRDGDAERVGRRGVAVSETNGLSFWQIASTLVVASSAPPPQRVNLLPPVMAAYRATGSRVMETHFALRLAQAHRALGDDEAALRVLEETGVMARETGQLWLEGERLSMEADILRARGDAVTASLASVGVCEP